MDKSYKNRGFNEYFEKTIGEKKIPYLSSFDVDSYIEEISSSKLSGGIIKSDDGKLVIDLINGTLTYDGESLI